MVKQKFGPCGKPINNGCQCKSSQRADLSPSGLATFGKVGGQKPQKDGGLKQVKAHPLTDSEIRQILGSNISILTNRDLTSKRHIDDIFDNEGRCILLYTPYDPMSGHWTCLLRKADHIEFFDSYGEPPDTEEDLGSQPPLLTQLLKQSGMPVFFNKHPFQSDKSDVATCGRHVVCRLLYFPFSLDKYANIIKKSNLSSDDFVSGLTFSKLKT